MACLVNMLDGLYLGACWVHISCEWTQCRDASLCDVALCFTLMVGEQGRRSRSKGSNRLGSCPRLLYLPGFSLSFICEFQFAYELFFCGPQVISWPRSSKHGIAADAWMVQWVCVLSTLAAGQAEQTIVLLNTVPLPHWKSFRPHQHVCLFLHSVWELRLLSHQALLKWQLSSADS